MTPERLYNEVDSLLTQLYIRATLSRKYLEDYGTHHRTCAFWRYEDPADCDCGFLKALQFVTHGVV